MTPSYSKMKRVLYRILGILCVILGGIGIVLPILPTTPFLLLAAWAFLRSSDRLYNWLIHHRVFGYYIKAYVKYKGVEKWHKIFALSMLWLTIGYSIYLVDKTWLEILLAVIAITVSIHILSLRILTKEEVMELERLEQEEQQRSDRRKQLSTQEH